MAKTDPVNISDPSGLSDPKLGDDYIRTLARASIELVNKDHFIGVATNGAYDEDDAGEHTKITFHAPLADHPAGKTVNSDETATDAHEGYLYLKDVANSDEDDVAELHFQDENGNHIQMSAEGYNYLEKPLMPNNTVFKAYNAAKDGFVELFKCNADGEFVFLIKAKLLSDSTTISSSELLFTNGVTEIKVGDVVTGETSGKSGTVRSITLSSGSWAGDDAAGSMQLVGSTGTFTSGEYLKVGSVVEMAKAGTYTAGTVGIIATEDYADTKEAKIITQETAGLFGEWTSKDSGGIDDLAKTKIYKATSDGFITAWVSGDFRLEIKTDADPTPSTTRIRVGTDSGFSASPCVTCPIKKNNYFQIVTNGTTVVINWLPFGTGVCEKQ